MKFKKPKFWDDNKISFWSIILFPISLIYLILFLIVKFLQSFKNNNKTDIPIICVGNIYLGGTGKTPLVKEIFSIVKSFGKNPAFIKKKYDYLIDEIRMLEKTGRTFVCNDRISGVSQCSKSDFNVAILDDGFQDYKIKKDLNIVCFSQDQLIGNGFVIPSGPLRESLNSLKRANIILINGEKDHQFEKKILKINKNLKIFYAKYKPINIEKFKDKNLLAVAGIGNPQSFFKLLEKNNLIIKKKIIYPDHYEFTDYEIQNIIKEAKNDNCKIIMTEKDYYKVKHFNISMDFLKVSLEIDKKEEFMERILKIYD